MAKHTGNSGRVQVWDEVSKIIGIFTGPIKVGTNFFILFINLYKSGEIPHAGLICMRHENLTIIFLVFRI